jgi:hypothetical protein
MHDNLIVIIAWAYANSLRGTRQPRWKGTAQTKLAVGPGTIRPLLMARLSSVAMVRGAVDYDNAVIARDEQDGLADAVSDHVAASLKLELRRRPVPVVSCTIVRGWNSGILLAVKNIRFQMLKSLQPRSSEASALLLPTGRLVSSHSTS